MNTILILNALCSGTLAVAGAVLLGREYRRRAQRAVAPLYVTR